MEIHFSGLGSLALGKTMQDNRVSLQKKQKKPCTRSHLKQRYVYASTNVCIYACMHACIFMYTLIDSELV